MNDLRASYARCRALNRHHGKTYFWATLLLPPDSRPHVYAIYGLCRYADDIVDGIAARPVPARKASLTELRDTLLEGLRRGSTDHPIVGAVVETARVHAIPAECFERFFRSMETDLTHRTYESYADLLEYMDGSAAVIGEMVLPVLGNYGHATFEPARDLGVAFQLTNFLRDVNEDLDRGRVYLPQEDLRRFGVNLARRQVTPEWRELMQFEIVRNRSIYHAADSGIDALPERSARCVRVARLLYSRILDEIEGADYDVFSKRAALPTRTKVFTVVRTMVRSGGTHDLRSGSRSTDATDLSIDAGTMGSKKP